MKEYDWVDEELGPRVDDNSVVEEDSVCVVEYVTEEEDPGCVDDD